MERGSVYTCCAVVSYSKSFCSRLNLHPVPCAEKDFD